MEVLKSMTEYVLEQEDKIDFFSPKDGVKAIDGIFNYARFLSMPLELKMFVPIDQNDNILSEPQLIEKRIGFDEVEQDYDYAEVKIYKEAKEEVIFEGFEYLKEIRNSGGNWTHILKKEELEIYIQWGGFYIVSERSSKEIKTIEDVLREFDSLTLTPQCK